MSSPLPTCSAISDHGASYAGRSLSWYWNDPRELTRHSLLDLPVELREQILAYCTRSTLAALTTTSKAIKAEAEAMLYEVVSLHEERQGELDGCLRTLTSHRKARLVRVFAVTFARGRNSKDKKRRRKQIKAYLASIQAALPYMTGLKMLSVWPPKGVETSAIEKLLCEQHFQLERLYIDSIIDIPQLLKCQPRLEIICLWFIWRYIGDFHLDAKRAELKRSLAQLRADTFETVDASSSAQRGQRCRVNPSVFGIEIDDFGLRVLTIFDSPQTSHEASTSVDMTYDVEMSLKHQQLTFTDGTGRNDLLSQYVREDLKLVDEPDRDENMCFLLPELSPVHIMWTVRVFSHMVGMYPLGAMPFVTLFVVDPPNPSIDVSTVHEPLKKLIATLLDANVDELQVQQYFTGTSDSAEHEGADVEFVFRKLRSIVREAVDEREPENKRFWFAVEDEEENFPFSSG